MKKFVVITGASSGIGYATAKAFAKRGKNLILVARRKNRLEEVKKEIEDSFSGIEVITKSCDLSDIPTAYSLYEELRSYSIETWINNAGFGDYASVSQQNLEKIENMLKLNIETLTILSTLYVNEYRDVSGTQLINLSSRGGYVLVPNAVTYCATKFYVSAFTEGLAHELKASGAKLKAKILAPAATKTEFGKLANNTQDYDYDKKFGQYHTSEQMADFLLHLYDSEKTLGIVDWETFEFKLEEPQMNYAGNSIHNQKHDVSIHDDLYERVVSHDDHHNKDSK